MGLLLSDTVLIDPLLDETLRLRDGLGAWAYAMDAAPDPYESEAIDPSEQPGGWRAERRYWMTSVACCSTDGGMVSPRAWAVLRLIDQVERDGLLHRQLGLAWRP